MTRRKEKGILCKLDVEKAYDKLNWKFLLTILREMGFGSKWIGWIQWCISTTSFSVILSTVVQLGSSKAQGFTARRSVISLSLCLRDGGILYPNR